MAFNGTEGGEISLETAADMTAAYRSANPGAIKARFFGRDILEDLMKQEGCMGLRIYYGLNEDAVSQLVVVGADADQNDMLNKIADTSIPCPDQCGAANVLNGNR